MLNVSFSDPSTADTFTASVNWGDSMPIQRLGLVTSPLAVQHSYRAARR